MQNELDFGRLLGRREAFNLVAGRCSAADAAILRDIRDKKLYEGYAEDWDDCCSRLLHTSKPNANRFIRCLSEFGTTYFLVAQFTRISPATYRVIAPAIRDETLHYNGEAIALIPENAEKVAAAVAELRKSAATPPPPPEDEIARLERRCNEVLKELEAAIGTREWPLQMKAVVNSLVVRAQRLELTI